MSAFLRVELTHASAVSKLYRRYCEVGSLPTQVGWGSTDLGVSATVPQLAGTFKGRGGAAAGVIAEVFKVFSLDRILQRLVGGQG